MNLECQKKTGSVDYMKNMQIAGLQKSSLLDYPSKIASVVFTLGCNFRCPYCHNPNLISAVSSEYLFDEAALFDFLKSRAGKLDAVVVSGGEPTLQKGLEVFFSKIKELGFLAKLDTNGTNPAYLEKLIEKGLLDYVAMDIKAPLEKYSKITGRNVDTDKIRQSINILQSASKQGLGYEFRTTVVRSQLDFDDFKKIGLLIKGSEKYYLQKFVPALTLDKSFKDETTYSNQEFEQIKDILKPFVKEVFVR